MGTLDTVRVDIQGRIPPKTERHRAAERRASTTGLSQRTGRTRQRRAVVESASTTRHTLHRTEKRQACASRARVTAR